MSSPSRPASQAFTIRPTSLRRASLRTWRRRPSDFLDGLQFEGSGDGGEDVEFPGQIPAIRAGGHLEFDEVTDRGGDDGLLVFEVFRVERFPFLLKLVELLGEGTREVGHDRGFLRNDEGFCHPGMPHTRRKVVLERGIFREVLFQEPWGFLKMLSLLVS